MPLHLNEFAREAFQGYIENVPPARERILARFLPVKPIYDIKFSYNVINGVYARTASITGFNAGAPLRDKQGLEKAFGEVAKVQHGFRLDEEELLRFNQPRNDEEQAQVVEYVYDQTDDLIEGIRDIEEWMRAQAIYTGAIAYDQNDIKLSVPFDLPATINITTKWTNTATATPLTDLQSAIDTYKTNNKQKEPGEMHLSTQVLNNILSNAQIKTHVYGSPTDSRIVTRVQLQELLMALGLPKFVINDDMVNVTGTDERLLPIRTVALLPNESIGKTYQGITVENNYKPGMYVLPEIQETNPPMQAVYVGETVFPAIEKPKAIQLLTV